MNQGIAVLAGVTSSLLAAAALLDAVLAWNGRLSVGARINRWAAHYPLYSLALIALLGALVAHFFLRPGS